MNVTTQVNCLEQCLPGTFLLLLSYPALCNSVTPWTAACQVSLFFTVSQSFFKFMSIDLVMLTISTSASPFSFCLQSLPASRSFPMSQLFTLGGQSIGASTSASVLPMNIQGWFPLVYRKYKINLSYCCFSERWSAKVESASLKNSCSWVQGNRNCSNQSIRTLC